MRLIGIVWFILALPKPAQHFVLVMIAPFFISYGIWYVIRKVVDRGRSVDQDPLVVAWEAAKTTKKCPDCAETILIHADVCEHCGYHFPPLGNVRCHHCRHVQAVTASPSTFVCEQCGAMLRRRTTPA
jgi:ribosomal protein S27E